MLGKFKTTKVIDSVTVGECFKAKREELGVTIHDLAAKLRIKPDYLESLENNDYDKLPPAVYIKGFIRSYAEFAGFDAEKMVNMFKREMAVRNNVKKISDDASKTGKRESLCPIITPRIVTTTFGAVVVLIVGYYLWHQINSFNSKPYLLISSPSMDSVVDNGEITVEGETEREISVEINGVEIYVDADGKFKEKISLQPGKNEITIEAKNRFDKVTKESVNIFYQKKLEVVPSGFIEERADG